MPALKIYSIYSLIQLYLVEIYLYQNTLRGSYMKNSLAYGFFYF